LFAWRFDNPTPLLHTDDPISLQGIISIQAHPKLPRLFMAVTRAVITIWDISQAGGPIHSLIIPVETPRIQCGCWAPDGYAVIASDTRGGVYIFRVAEMPECISMPEFYPTDFTVSAWIPDEGQVEESNHCPVHKQSRSVLLDERKQPIYKDYAPHSLADLTAEAIFGSVLKYAWLNEEIWARKLTDHVVVRTDQRVTHGRGRRKEVVADTFDAEVIESDIEAEDEKDEDVDTSDMEDQIESDEAFTQY
jgi:hypothetical protein